MSQDTYSAYIVSVVKDIEIQPKKDIPTFEKKIKDTNDTTGDTTEWQDSADYDIGDRIPFQLKGTVAADYDKYDKYTLHSMMLKRKVLHLIRILL